MSTEYWVLLAGVLGWAGAMCFWAWLDKNWSPDGKIAWAENAVLSLVAGLIAATLAS